MSTQTERPMWKVVLTDVQWTNLFNPRMWFAAFWTGLLAGIALGMAGVPEAIYVPFSLILMGVFLVATMFNPARCPQCRYRVKIGATACRNGHPVGAQR